MICASCIYIYIFIYVHTYVTYVHVRTYVYTRVDLYLLHGSCVSNITNVNMLDMYTCIYMQIYVHMNMHTHVYTCGLRPPSTRSHWIFLPQTGNLDSPDHTGKVCTGGSKASHWRTGWGCPVSRYIYMIYIYIYVASRCMIARKPKNEFWGCHWKHIYLNDCMRTSNQPSGRLKADLYINEGARSMYI